MYSIIAADQSGTRIGVIDRYSGLSFTRSLNKVGTCTFSVAYSDAKAEYLRLGGLTQIYVYKDDQVVWGGYIESLDGTITESETTYRVSCKSFINLLRYRYSPKVVRYTATDAGDLVWDQIDTSMSQTHGSLPITLGTIEPSFDVDKTLEFKQLYELLTDLSVIKDGFDFEVTQTGVFNIYYPRKGQDKSQTHIFRLGKNVHSVRHITSTDNMSNQIIAVGAYYGDALLSAVREDASLQSSYAIWSKLIAKKDIEDLAELQGYGDENLYRYSTPRREFDLVQKTESLPDWTDLDVGDYIKLIATQGAVQIADTVRIQSISVSVSDGGTESVSYSLSYV